MLLWSRAALHCEDVDWLPVSSACFPHMAARGSFPKWMWGFSDALCLSCSPGQAARGRSRGCGAHPDISWQFCSTVIWKHHSSWATAVFRQGKKEKKKAPAAVWDSDQAFSRIYTLSFKDNFSKLLQHLSSRKLKETVWRKLLVYILKFRFITNNQAPVEYKLVALHLRN